MGDQRHPGLGHGAGQTLEDVVRARAETEAVADRDAAFETGRAGTFGEGGNFQHPRLAGVVDVRVDAGAVLLGESEQQIELAVQVPVLDDGVDAADHVRPHRQRLVHQLQGAGGGEHAVLREGDDLEVGGVGEGGLDLQ